MRNWIFCVAMALAGVAFSGEYTLPKLPDGLVATIVAKAPEVNDIACIAVSADGRKVYIGEHHSANGNGKWGQIRLLQDVDGDGKYEKMTVFAEELGGEQGLLCVDDTVYVVHSPLLTSLRDTDGDGVAEERKTLLEGIGPPYKGGLHDHTSSGLVLGTDGWLYISIGDWGVHQAKGSDGKSAQLYGGGVLRVRPDGTDVEVFCLGLRNTMDVAMDPELNTFTRDNTNDGGGWNVRSSHILQSAQYGYPNLFKNYVEETLPCMEDHGGGSGTGGIWFAEKGLREEDRNKLFYTDWGRATIYRYDLERKNATYVMKQNDWFKAQNPFRAIDMQPDAQGNMYIADWGRGGWGKPDVCGGAIKVSSANPTKTEVPNFAALDTAALIDIFAGESQILRLSAQKYLILQGEKALPALLKVIGADATPRLQRVFALWTYKQIAKQKATPALLALAEKRPEFRELALRAVTDRKGEIENVPLPPFLTAIKDNNPFVRTQAAICLGRIATKDGGKADADLDIPMLPGKVSDPKKWAPEIAMALCEALNDSELHVRHLAMRSLRSIQATDQCLKKVEESGPGTGAQMALIALREIYDDRAVDGLIDVYKKVPAERKADVLRTIGRLGKKEDEWKANWWGTQPNTVGPYQRPVAWKNTDKLAAALKAALDEKDEMVVAAALAGLATMRDTSSAPEVLKLAADPRPAIRSAALKVLSISKPPEAAPMFAKLLMDQAAKEDERKLALDALDKMHPASEKPLAEALVALDKEFKDKKFDKLTGLLPRTRKALSDVKSEEIIPVLRELIANTELSDETRVVAAQALSSSKSPAAAKLLESLLNEKNPDLVAMALKNIDPKGSVKLDQVRAFAQNADVKIKGAAFVALGRLKDESAAETIALTLKTQNMQEAALDALLAMGPVGSAVNMADTAERLLGLIEEGECLNDKLEKTAMAAAREWIAGPALPNEQRSKLEARAMAVSGQLNWRLMGPLKGLQKVYETAFDVEKCKPEELAAFKMKVGDKTFEFKPTPATADGLMVFDKIWPVDSGGALAYGYAEIESPVERKANFVFGSDDNLQVYLNGEKIYSFPGDRGLDANADKFTGTLKAGRNYLLAKVGNNGGGWGLAGRVDAPKTKNKRKQLREALISEALAKTGDAKKGEALFNDEKRVGCTRCHQINAKGGNVGPDLSSIGATKEKRYLIDSVLDPSKDLAQGFQTMKIAMQNGKVVFGVILNQSPTSFELATAEGKREPVTEADVKDKTPVPQSVMPEGLADMLTREEFIDLVAYLTSLKK